MEHLAPLLEHVAQEVAGGRQGVVFEDGQEVRIVGVEEFLHGPADEVVA